MKIRIGVIFSPLLAMTALFTSGSVVQAQPTAPAKLQSHPELALDYSYVHSNAPPGGCTCFNLNGGSATFAWPVASGNFALVGDASVAHAGSIRSGNYDLTLSTFTAGIRYSPRLGRSPLNPFGQVLVGVAHSSGSLVSGQNPTVSNAGAAFAGMAGGGLDLGAGRRFSLRIIEADYLATTFQNGVNDHQNNLRLSAGVVLHF
jgi:outer membrane immunogenic protein